MLSSNYNDQVLYLEGDLQVHHLEGIKGELVTWAADPNPLTLDLSQVAEVDIAGLQMVLSFLRSRKSQSKVIGVGPELTKALQITGLAPHFAQFLN